MHQVKNLRNRTRPNIAKIRTAVSRIRRRRKILGRPATEARRESLARNFVARTVIVPMLRWEFGSAIKAVLLVGSSQLGIRKATRRPTGKRWSSDLDIRVIVDSSRGKVIGWDVIDDFLEKLETTCGRFGIEAQISYREEPAFITLQKTEKNDLPFQVIYGKEWAEASFGKEYLARFPGLRERIRKSPQYTSRK